MPEIFKGWEGYTEVREKEVLPESWDIIRFLEPLDEVREEGWEAVVKRVLISHGLHLQFALT